MTTPTAYVGGEPLKAYLLKRCAVDVDVRLSCHCGENDHDDRSDRVHFDRPGPSDSGCLVQGDLPAETIATALLSVGLLAFGVGGFVLVQRRGIFTRLRSCSTQSASEFLFSSHAGRASELDRIIAGFYVQ